MKILFPGTFDPPSLGHLNLIERASHLFDEVMVGVAINRDKNPFFTLEERKGLVEKMTAHCANVRVEIYEGLTAEFAEKEKVDILIRGLRGGVELGYERALAIANQKQTGIETLFIPTSSGYSYIESSIIRDIAQSGGDLRHFIPQTILEEVSSRLT